MSLDQASDGGEDAAGTIEILDMFEMDRIALRRQFEGVPSSHCSNLMTVFGLPVTPETTRSEGPLGTPTRGGAR